MTPEEWKKERKNAEHALDHFVSIQRQHCTSFPLVVGYVYQQSTASKDGVQMMSEVLAAAIIRLARSGNGVPVDAAGANADGGSGS